MTKFRRPDGWEDHTGEGWDRIYGEAFEAGADAMLEALLAEGSPTLLEFVHSVLHIHPIETIGRGKFIFIPEEE